jgi:thiol-disulfide isomerase/thioredoxin
MRLAFFGAHDIGRRQATDLKRQYLMRAAFLTGLVLSVISELDICRTSACTETHKYVLFGFPFTLFGIVFFLTAWAAFELGRTRKVFSTLFVLMISAASGSELAFLWIQKYVIKDWCPLCVGIAATVYLLSLSAYYAGARDVFLKSKDRREIVMLLFKKVSLISLLIIAGFLIAYKGAQKSEAQDKVPNIFLGNEKSAQELYIFTDWFCPACRMAEPEIDKAVSSAGKKVKIVFIDVPIHAETFNYMPYNLSFLMNEKGKYLELRKALGALTLKSKEPGPEEVQKAIAPLNVTYKPLAFLTVTKGLKFNDETAKAFGVKSTPTVVVHNTETKKKVQMVGSKDITEQNIMKALDDVSK